MGKKTTDSNSATTTPKKTRAPRKPQYFLARLTGESDPVVIVAATLKKAQAAIVSVKPASAADLISAGANGYRTIDTTAKETAVKDDSASTVTDISQAA